MFPRGRREETTAPSPPTPERIADTENWSKESKDGIDVVSFLGERWFEVRESKIEGAGMGLFAAREFNRLNIIGRYTGRRTTDEEIDETGRDCAYLLRYEVASKTADGTADGTETIVVDANPVECGPDFKHAGWMHMMNDAKDPAKTNVFFTSRGFARALKKINENDELFVNYSLDYWCHEAVTCVDALWLPMNDAQTVPKCVFEMERGL